MLDVFLGIGFTSVMIMYIVFCAVRVDRTQPWFVPLKMKTRSEKAATTPWKRGRV